jgi:cytochrome P450
MPGTYDLLSPDHFSSPWATFARMRADDPLYWCEPMGLHVATRYADVRAISRDRRFSAARVDAFMSAGTDDRTEAVRRFFSDWMTERISSTSSATWASRSRPG